MFPQVNIAEIKDKILTAEELLINNCNKCKYCEKILHEEEEQGVLVRIENSFNNFFCTKNIGIYKNSLVFIVRCVKLEDEQILLQQQEELQENTKCPGK